MSVKINWTFTNYNDVGSVVICRSKVLNNEKDFEDALNGIANVANYPTILTTIGTSNLTSGTLQSYTDTQALDYSTTYYYCVAAKGTGSNGVYKVGTGADASTAIVTHSGNSISSVAAFTTGSSSSSANLFTVTGINFLNWNSQPVDQSQMTTEQSELDSMVSEFQDALDWLRGLVSLPPGGLTHEVTLDISEGFDPNITTLATMLPGGHYTTSADHSAQPYPFGKSFTRTGLMTLNAPFMYERAHKEFSSMYMMDPEDPNYYFQTIVHELVHMMGMNSLVMDPSGTYTSNAPITKTSESSDKGWLFRGAQATKEYRRYVMHWLGTTDPADVAYILGPHFEDNNSTSSSVEGHWEEDKPEDWWHDADGNNQTGTPNRTINGGEYPAPSFDVISSRKTVDSWRYEDPADPWNSILYFRSSGWTTRLTLGMLQDVGYIVNWDNYSQIFDRSPITNGSVSLTDYPYPTN